MKFSLTEKNKLWLAPLFAASLALSACGSDDDPVTSDTTDTTDTNGASGRVMVTAQAGVDSASVEIYNTTEPYEGQTRLNGGVSDTIVRVFEDNYYVIRRYLADSITAYSINDPSSVIFQTSTNDGNVEESSNPHDLVFVDDQKGYLVRYGSSKLWQVNPSATDAAQFKTGEIDLSAYDEDGIPQATRAVVAGDKLFVFMQRLDPGFAPVLPGVVAVFDTSNGVEIDTGTNGSFKGIELPAFNPWELTFDEASGSIFVAAAGDFGSTLSSRDPAYTGGIITVDTADYSTNLLIDDTEETGRMMGVEVIDANTAFLISQQDWFVSSVVKFDPNTGAILDSAFGGITGVDVRDIAKGPAGNLWVAIAAAENPRLVKLNPADGTQIGADLITELNPIGINFID